MNDLRSLFAADQQTISGLPVGNGGAGGGGPAAGEHGAGLGGSAAGGHGLHPRAEYVGWGGQAIPDSQGFRVPWFGRTRVRGGNARARTVASTARGEQTLPGAFGRSSHSMPSGSGGSSMGGFDSSHQDALTVEQCIALIQKLPKNQPIPERIYRALYHFDSRVLSLLLKDLSKAQMSYRAVELFDYLRSLDPGNLLASLCDVYTYTAMISMCIYQQDCDRAMELMDDMCIRNVERNVHTYTALMNVCIKCGKHTVALEIYNSMRAAKVTPNVVTYNSLVDVYGKLGQWEKAAHVLHMMKTENVQPVLRTYNTVLIACNMSNQPREALAIYHQMLSEGFTPNSTTYNALISAYGKIGQLDKVLEVYNEMVYKNCERTVITYSSLISACEKAGRWELALKLFNDMQQEGCVPNTVTYNSLITACAQGAQWEQASRVFEQMQTQGCTPDVVTYTALISAFERAGQWQMALRAFQQMCIQGCRPDAIVYNAIIDTLWETGVSWAQQKALQLFQTAVKQMHFQQQPISAKGPCSELNLHAMTAGVAMLSLFTWMQDIRNIVSSQGEMGLPPNLVVVTDKGKTCKEQGNHVVKEAVAAMMSFWEAPFRLVQDGAYGGMLVADSHSVGVWVMSSKFDAQLNCLFPFDDTAKDNGFSVEDAIAKREAPVEEQCMQAFQLVQQFENTHGLSLQNMGSSYLQNRSTLVKQLIEQGTALQLQDEVVHDAVLLMDRAVSASKEVPNALLPLVGASSLCISAKQGEPEARQPSLEDMQAAADIPAHSIQEMEFNVCRVLNGDTQAISAMRCLCVYLERLGHSFLDLRSQHGLSGLAKVLITGALYDSSFLNCRPSVVAAALLYAERRLRGCVPFWPSMLAKLTGHQDMTSPELTVAVSSAQKLCRSVHLATHFQEQACALSPVTMLHPANDMPLLTPAGGSGGGGGSYLTPASAGMYSAGQYSGLEVEEVGKKGPSLHLGGKPMGSVGRMQAQGGWSSGMVTRESSSNIMGKPDAAPGVGTGVSSGFMGYSSQGMWAMEEADMRLKMQQQQQPQQQLAGLDPPAVQQPTLRGPMMLRNLAPGGF